MDGRNGGERKEIICNLMRRIQMVGESKVAKLRHMAIGEDAYLKLLEDKFLTYKELSSVTVEDNGEPMVNLGSESSIRIFSIDERMKKYTGNSIFVRKSLVQKLHTAQDTLASIRAVALKSYMATGTLVFSLRPTRKLEKN